MSLRLERIIKQLYFDLGQREPAIIWCDSPWQLMMTVCLARSGGRANLTPKQIYEFANRQRRRHHDGLWAPFWENMAESFDRVRANNAVPIKGKDLDFSIHMLWNAALEDSHKRLTVDEAQVEKTLFSTVASDLRLGFEDAAVPLLQAELDLESRYFKLHNYRCGVQERNTISPMLADSQATQLQLLLGSMKAPNLLPPAVLNDCASLMFFTDCCFVSHRPMVLETNVQLRLHNGDGPSIEFRDGYAFYHIDGVAVPPNMILEPSTFTPEVIMQNPNVESRRVLIDHYGRGEFLRDAGARAVQHDECGTLFRLRSASEEEMVYVEVINSTAEQDGSHKPYYLRVPPSMESAREAVAWTFSIDTENYLPDFET